METGCLYLIPSLIADVPPLEVIPLSVKKVIDSTQHFIVENEKSGRAFIKKIVPEKDQAALIIHLLNKFTAESELDDLLRPCLKVIHGLISDAGAPSVADPGSSIVSRAYQRNIRVSPLSGPSSILMAVMASGMNGQDFALWATSPSIGQSEKQIVISSGIQGKRGSPSFHETPIATTSCSRTRLLRSHLMFDFARSAHQPFGRIHPNHDRWPVGTSETRPAQTTHHFRTDAGHWVFRPTIYTALCCGVRKKNFPALKQSNGFACLFSKV